MADFEFWKRHRSSSRYWRHVLGIFDSRTFSWVAAPLSYVMLLTTGVCLYYTLAEVRAGGEVCMCVGGSRRCVRGCVYRAVAERWRDRERVGRARAGGGETCWVPPAVGWRSMQPTHALPPSPAVNLPLHLPTTSPAPPLRLPFLAGRHRTGGDPGDLSFRRRPLRPHLLCPLHPAGPAVSTPAANEAARGRASACWIVVAGGGRDFRQPGAQLHRDPCCRRSACRPCPTPPPPPAPPPSPRCVLPPAAPTRATSGGTRRARCGA